MTMEIRQHTKTLSVLFVEDEKDAREMGGMVFGLLFDNVYLAKNGEDGLNIYREKKPDIIITDIQMPVMDGLTMIREIRKDDEAIPVIVTTAHSDDKYFIESIKLGIDRYILKPIVKDECVDTIFTVSKRLLDKKNAAEYEKRRIQEKINLTAHNVASSLSNAYPTPVLVASKQKPVFINDAFRTIFPKELLNKLENGDLLIDSFIQNRGDCSYEPPESNINYQQQNLIICVKVKAGKKIYLVDQKDIFLEGDVGECKVYSFTDITLLEYQRLKLKNNYERLRELFIARQKSITPSSNQVAVEKEDAQKSQQALLIIGENEKDILRKSRKHKISAHEYMLEISDDILDELAELAELEQDMDEALAFFEEKFTLDSLGRFLGLLGKYTVIIKRLVEFSDLVFALESLRVFLASLTNEMVDAKKIGRLPTYLSNIRADLVNWRTTVFASQSAQDIHYLDSSLFSSCLQVQMDFNGTNTVEEDELDIFF